LKLKITETFIKRHKPKKEKEQTDVFDTGQPGLILRISWGGAKTFRVKYRDDKGKPRTFKLGRWHESDFNVDAAREAAKKFVYVAPTQAKPTTAKAALTFRQVVEEYLAKVVVTFRTSKETERCLRKYAIPVLGDRKFMEIDSDEVKELHEALAPNGPRQAAIVVALIRAVMMWFAEENPKTGYVCPVKYSSRRKKSGRQRYSGRSRTLNKVELRMVWNAASQMGQFGGFVKLLLLTGQRRQCLATARWSEFDGDLWTIPEVDGGKFNAEILRLPPLAMTILNDLPRIKGNPFVFGVIHKGEHKPFNSFSQRCKELNDLMPEKISRWTLHDLRRTARTLMTDIEIDDQIAEIVLGHKQPGIASVYNKSKYLKQTTTALLQLAEHIWETVNPMPEGANVVPIASRRA
jgi:integrase